jgi:Tol biopolymer transport system component
VLAVLGPLAVLAGAVLAVRQDFPVEVSTASSAVPRGAEGTTPTSTSTTTTTSAVTTPPSGPTTTVTEARSTTTRTAPRATTTQPAPTTTRPPTTTTTTVAPLSTTTTAPRRPVRLAFTDTDPGGSFAGYFLRIYDFATGAAQTLATNVSFYPSWSPDGHSLAFGDDQGIEVFDTTSGQRRLLSPPLSGNPPRRDTWPSWSPDGKRIAFHAATPSGYQIFTIGADGSSPKNLTADQTLGENPMWSPDAWIAFTGFGKDAGGLFLVRPDGSELHRAGSVGGGYASWSPDGRWVTYGGSAPSGLHLLDVSTGSDRLLVAGASVAAWAPDGSFLAFEGTCGGGQQNLCRMTRDGGAITVVADYVAGGRPVFAPAG